MSIIVWTIIILSVVASVVLIYFLKTGRAALMDSHDPRLGRF